VRDFGLLFARFAEEFAPMYDYSDQTDIAPSDGRKQEDFCSLDLPGGSLTSSNLWRSQRQLFFRPFGASSFLLHLPTARAVGFILAPLRG
jgi:hypothetical protein